jgi:glycosyltransferase involved in cell wall biosynthesis
MASYLPGATLARSSVIPHIALDQLLSQPTIPSTAKFRLVHTGDVRPPRNPLIFLEGLLQFIGKSENSAAIEVIFMGRHPNGFREQIALMKLERHVTILDEQSYEKSISLVEGCDMGIVIEAPCETGIFLPGKAVEYMQCGKPILAVSPKVGTLNDMLSSFGGGLCADCTSQHSIADALSRLYASWKGGRLLQDYSTSRLLHEFSEQRVVSAFREAVEGVLLQRQENRVTSLG